MAFTETTTVHLSVGQVLGLTNNDESSIFKYINHWLISVSHLLGLRTLLIEKPRTESPALSFLGRRNYIVTEDAARGQPGRVRGMFIITYWLSYNVNFHAPVPDGRGGVILLFRRSIHKAPPVCGLRCFTGEYIYQS